MALTATVSHTFNSVIPDDPAAIAAGEVTPQTAWNGVGAHTVNLTGTASDAQLADVITAGGPTGSATAVPVLTYDAKGRLTAVTTASITQPTGANPSASVGLTAVNGSASTFMRSDGAPALDQTAAYAFIGLGATTISAAASGAAPLTISNYSLTGSQAQSALSITGTLNTSSSPDVFKIAITNTAKGSSTKALNIYNGATSQFSVDPTGYVSIGGNGVLASLYTTSSGSGRAFYFANADTSNVSVGIHTLNASGGNGLRFDNTAVFGWSATSPDGTIAAGFSYGRSTGIIQLGLAAAASPVAQTLQAQGSRAGTDSNVGGANLTVQSGQGTGTGTGSDLVFKTPALAASGSGAQTMTTALTLKGGTQRVVASAPVGLPGYTVATLPAGVQGDNAYVTDALAPTFLATIVGGGAIKTPVFYDGTNWVGA